jgi:hypothetical protein
MGAGARLTARSFKEEDTVEVYFPVLITGDKLIGYGKVRAERACSIARHLHAHGSDQ